MNMEQKFYLALNLRSDLFWPIRYLSTVLVSTKMGNPLTNNYTEI